MPNVTDNSHDCDPFWVLLWIIECDTLAKRILIRPKLFRERLIHDNDPRCVDVVGISKEPAFN
jgi:hypothetical protein